MSARPVCAVDTETTGLGWDREAWEIALIRREPNGATDEIRLFLDVDVHRADRIALEIGGYHRRHPRARFEATGDPRHLDGLVSPARAARLVRELTDGATIVGAVPSFDTHVLEMLLARIDLEPSWHHRLRCVESMSAGRLGRDVGGLVDCAAALEVDYPLREQHTALGDARVALAVYDRILRTVDAAG